MLPLKIYANVECCHDFMAKMNVGMAKMNGVLSWHHRKDGCWHGFDANEVLIWLGANIGATSM